MLNIENVASQQIYGRREDRHSQIDRNATGVTPVDTTIDWLPCPFNDAPGVEADFDCANFTVPLDYSDSSSNQTLELSLVRLNATKRPSKGSVLLNPGGPGGSGFLDVVGSGVATSTVVGGAFDLSEQTAALEKLPKDLNASDTAPGNVWTSMELISDLCNDTAKDVGELIGTTFVVRDMVNIIDALGEDGKLRYWGTSYGTILGATFAAMFPEKVDKVVLDAVANSHDYQAGFMKQAIVDTDGALDGFYSGCIDASDGCVLAQGRTAKELSSEVGLFLEKLKYSPIPVPDAESPGTITYENVKATIFSTLYRPEQWSSLASDLNQVMAGNVTDLSLLAPSTPSEDGIDGLVNMGIRCGDSFPPSAKLEELAPVVREEENLSAFAGSLYATDLFGCVNWKIQAKERYSGDFVANTSFPLLFIGNSYDPVTPLASALNMSAGFANSAVLHQNSYGHGSLAQPSLCTAKVIQAYFNNGTVPKNGTVCQPDAKLFANASLSDFLRELNESSSDRSGKLQARSSDLSENQGGLSAQDAELLDALGALSRRTTNW
ncbi:MAG: hypothetical protein M1819_005262 [Sarea resinae]|nr:MAG: hypothetical protein M1819_005262 [Sarea resinae]